MTAGQFSIFGLQNVGAIVLIAVLVSGCNGAPVVRSDTEKNFRKSVEEIARRAPQQKIEALDSALRTIVLSRAISHEADRHSHFVSFTDSIAGTSIFVSPLEDWNVRRSEIVVSRIGRAIDGRTLDNIIELGIREKAALDARMRDWTARQVSTPDTMWTSEATTRMRIDPADHKLLASVHISGVQMNVVTRKASSHMLSFTLDNRSEQNIRAVTFASRSEAETGHVEGRSLIRYEMPMPLAPGSKRKIITSLGLPDDFSPELVIVGLEDVRGRRTGLSPDALQFRAPSILSHNIAMTDKPMLKLQLITR